MYRKLCFLASFILVLALSGALQAASIDVNNGSFELQVLDGNIVDANCHIWIGATEDEYILGWVSGYLEGATYAGWSTTDVNCGAPGMCSNCRDWMIFPDGNTIVGMSQGNYVYQLLDHNIVEGYKYTLTHTGQTWFGEAFDQISSFYYLNEPCEPDVNHLELGSKTTHLIGYLHGNGRSDWYYDIKTYFVAEAGKPYLNERLGIKILSPLYEGWWMWTLVDDIQVEWGWATQAYNPNPEDGATGVSEDANLIWNPGLWPKDVNGHDVYFGSTWAEVNSATTASSEFQGVQSPNEFDPGALVLGGTYHWRIDEVNENYTKPPGPANEPPNGKWKGDIWSFTVEGGAINPIPADGAGDVPRNIILRWTAGAQSKWHDVYFGSAEAEVTAATTSSPEYITRLNLGTEEYDAGGNHTLVVAEDYWWRIDEVNYMTVKGDLWDFTIADYILVESFDFYENPTDLRVVWKDALSGHTGEGEVWVNKDETYAVDDGYSMQFHYFNDNKEVKFSETQRSYSTAQDWSYAGNKVTELEIDWFGDINSVPDPPMYVKLSDGSTTVQVNPGPNDVTDESQHTWHIPLSDFNDGGVTLSGITSIILGIGPGAKEIGQTVDRFGTVYFDDIRLYPPRCYAAYAPTGDFTGDCKVDINDLNVMVVDWLLADANVPTSPSPGDLNGFTNDPCQWVTGHIGSGALMFEGNTTQQYIYVNEPTLNGLRTMTISTWVKLDGEQPGDYVGLVSSRVSEYPDPAGGDGSELGLGKGSHTVGYCWNEISATWQFTSGLVVPDANWTFVAMVVDPTGCSMYARVEGEAMQTPARHDITLPALEQFEDWMTIGWSAMQTRYIKGLMDDVRIYDTNLSYADINDLAFQTAEPCDSPVYWYKLDETSGMVAADSGTPITVYQQVMSQANLTDPEAKLQRSVNLRDYAILANDWLTESMWPPAP